MHQPRNFITACIILARSLTTGFPMNILHRTKPMILPPMQKNLRSPLANALVNAAMLPDHMRINITSSKAAAAVL